MRKNYLTIICIVVLFILICPSIVISSEQVRCTGNVVDAQGQPIAGAKVTAYEMLFDGIAGNFMLHKAGEIITAEDGTFYFETKPKPQNSTFYECKIVAVKPDLALGWTVWNMREDIESNIELGRPERLEGVIVDEAGVPVAGAQVRANLLRTKETDGEEKSQWLPGIAPLEELGAQTNHQGRFFFNNLPADSGVDLLIKAEGKAMIFTYQSAPRGPAFKAGQTDIKVVLPDEAQVEGRIIDPDTGEGIAGVKFAVVYTASGAFYYRFACTTDDDGTFSIGGLLSSKYLIRGEILPGTYVNAKSGQTTKVTIQANKPYYGRIFFEDGSPVVIKPEPWPGAETRIDLVEDERTNRRSIVDIDDEGYLKVYLSQEQYQKLQSRKAWFEVLIPDIYTSVDERRVMRLETVFAIDLLATDKTKAGVAKIPKPRREPDSLVGKSLPELKALEIDLPQTAIQSKRLLVCFFDINQRPSRNCIMQLAKQEQGLKEKGVVIVAVQTTKVEQEKLDEWIKENNIDFLVGMIQADEEKTRFIWGVKSLPWLILTDAKHVVTAEGFTINELEEKIER